MSGRPSDTPDAADNASILGLDRRGVDQEQEGHTVCNGNCLPSVAVHMRVRSRDGQGIAVDDRNVVRKRQSVPPLVDQFLGLVEALGRSETQIGIPF